ncbi:hypothetical protein CBFG_03401 [Clostridiales bacterium 1_7_47FAA]|nr:hypothetical protein CBFG_03401 [Clostridiales bacterium 1_7_47FAA]
MICSQGHTSSEDVAGKCEAADKKGALQTAICNAPFLLLV